MNKESSIVPLWISFPRLQFHLFQKDAIFSIASLIGPTLRVDDATAKLRRPSVAQVQIELDVLLERPKKMWIQMGSQEEFWQIIEYKNVPTTAVVVDILGIRNNCIIFIIPHASESAQASIQASLCSY